MKEEEKNEKLPEILIILSAYKRDYFREQIEAIKKSEGVIIKKILLWQNENHVNVDYLREYGVEIIKSDVNIKYHGRYTLPLLFDYIEYTCIFDDDTIPSSGWISNAVRCCETYNCISTQNGRIYNQKTKMFDGFGDNGFCPNDTLADLGGHSVVFKTSISKYMFYQKIISYENGEEITLCMSAKYHANIPTYCVKQDITNTGNTRMVYGGDENASYRKNINHNELRSHIMEEWIKRINNK